MGNETKFHQLLKFGRRENGLGYLSHESKSSSSSARARRKNKLISSLISLDNGEEVMNKCGVQKNDKKERTKRTTKDGLTSSDEFTALDDVKLFVKSLLEDLKEGREKLFVWMEEEMGKLVADDADLRRGKRETGNKRRSGQLQEDDQTDIEQKMELHNQTGFEENNLLHHQKSVRTNNLVQHQNSSKENIHMQHHNKVKNAKVQNSKVFEENTHVQAENNFKSGTTDQTSIDRSLERFTKESGFDNYYQTLEDLDDYAQPTRGENLAALHVKPNAQCFPANHITQMNHQKNFLSGMESENCNDVNLVNLIEGKKTTNPNFHNVLQYQGAYDQEVESITASLKEKEDLGLSIDANFAFHPSNQVASSMDLVVPTALTRQSSLENQRLDTSSFSYNQPTVDANRKGINLGGENHHGYYSGMPMEEPKRSFPIPCSENVGSFVQRSTPNTIIGNEFLVSLHQGMDNGFSIPRNQFIFDQERNDMSGLKIDGGAMNFSGGSYDLSEHYVANMFSSHSN